MNAVVSGSSRVLVTTLLVLFCGVALAQDVTRPAIVNELRVDRVGGDAVLAWDPVTLDAADQPESVDFYNVYRGTSADFVPDKDGGSNRVGSPAAALFTDPGAAADVDDYYYLISAVDAAGNESDTSAPIVSSVPLLTGDWTASSIDVFWTPASPELEVASYRVYYGRGSHQYEFVEEVDATTNDFSLSGVQLFVNWYIAVTAVDVNGNETEFSNEHIDAVGGRVALRGLDADELCWGGDCFVAPGRVQRNSGFQILAPVDFPEGDWTSVSVTFTMDSRLCSAGQQGTVSKCGAGNPCPDPPCNGGYNPCGDPWDRLAKLFLVLDDCIEQGGSCVTNNNLELMRAVTPFGSDAASPDGSGVVPPRRLTLDITPFASLLSGRKYVGAEIVHFVQSGWWVTADFLFSERPQDTSPKPPADGIQIVGYQNAPLATTTVDVPATASSVNARIFTSGHGGSTFCDGGTNDAQACAGSGDCPGGVCNPCDEFCHRNNRLLSSGSPIWEVVPWRTDCSGLGIFGQDCGSVAQCCANGSCSDFNACGCPSCTFPRAGWCPGMIACWNNEPCDNDLDLTQSLVPGGSYDLSYDIVPQNGSWPVSVVVYWYD